MVGFVLYNCWDIKDKVKVIHMAMVMPKDALLDGTIDAVCSGGMYFCENGFKCSRFNNAVLAARKNVYFLGLNKKEFDTGIAQPPPQPYK